MVTPPTYKPVNTISTWPCWVLRLRSDMFMPLSFRTSGKPKSSEWRNSGETDLSAEQARAKASSRLQGPDGNDGWRARDPASPRQGPQEVDGLAHRGRAQWGRMGLATLKRRSEFLRIRGGQRWSCDAFVIEGKARPENGAVYGPPGAPANTPRFGFTVTRKIGSAVTRNRIRRRLREALRIIPPGLARDGWDYVVVARPGAATVTFSDLQTLLLAGLGKLHAARTRSRQ